MASNPTNTTAVSSSSVPAPSVFGATNNSSGSGSSQAPAPSSFIFGQPASTSTDAPAAKAAFVFGQSQDSQPSAPSAAPLNSTPAPTPAQPFIFGASTSAAAPPAAAAPPSFGFGAAAPSAASSSGLCLKTCNMFLLGLSDNKSVHALISLFLFPQQLHLQLLHLLHSAQLLLVDLGTVRLLHLAHPSDLLLQPRLPRPQPSEPIPAPPLSLDSRPTPPLYLGQLRILHQVSKCQESVNFNPVSL